MDPLLPAVISLGSIHSGQTHNVIPSELTMSGTVRYLDRKAERAIREAMDRLPLLAQAHGGEAEILWEGESCPPSRQDPGMLTQLHELIRRSPGVTLNEDVETGLGAEDFAFFGEQRPSVYFFVGGQIPGHTANYHAPDFDVDERALPVGAALLADAAREFLGKDEG